MVGNPAVTALLQEGQKRAAPVTSVPQAGQLMAGARVYHCLQQALTPQTRATNRSLPPRPIPKPLQSTRIAPAGLFAPLPKRGPVVLAAHSPPTRPSP
jgi:hypothetical protein